MSDWQDIATAKIEKFLGWKLAELLTYVVGFPFLFIGAWLMHASDWCHDRALRHEPLPSPPRDGGR